MKKITLFLVVFLILTCFGNVFTGVAFADTASKYTDVLEDLGKDETFDTAQYPASDKDTMDVFQIAESSAGELFLYVYSTTGDKFTASEARISQSIGENMQPKDYKLTLLSRNGTLSKYIVNDLTVSSEVDRIYAIIQIARPWDKYLDEKPTDDNTVNTVAYPVSKQFRAISVDGSVQYSEAHEKTIEITAKYCGYLRNFMGWVVVSSGKADSHFIAFDTDFPIDKLMEATVTYDSIEYMEKVSGWGTIVNTHTEYPNTKKTGIKATLKAEKEIQTPTIGLFGKEYRWNEIQSVVDFLELEEVTDTVKEKLQGKKWVLRFALTPVVEQYTSVTTSTFDRFGVTVTDASILRLRFITNGVTYNLGVIDNKQTEGDKPSNPTPDNALEETVKRLEKILKAIGDWFVRAGQWLAQNWWVIIVGVVVIVIVVSLFFQVGRQVLGAIFIGIGKALWWFVKYLGIGLFYVITSPYWIIRAIVLAARKRKGR